MTQTQDRRLSHNIGFDLLRAMNGHKDKVAFAAPDGNVTYERLHDLTLCFAANLKARGVGQGAVVALAEMDEPTFFAMLTALSLLGATWVHGTPAALTSGLKISQLVHGSRADRLAGSNEFRLDETWTRMPDGSDKRAFLPFAGYAASTATACILQSSGSTGSPKLMACKAGTLAARLSQPRLKLGVPVTRVRLLMPIGAWINFEWSARMVLQGGCVLVRMGPDEAVAARADVVAGSPVQLGQFVGLRRHDGPPQIAAAYVTGAPAGLALRRRLLGLFHKLRIGYGSTETGSVAQHLIDQRSVEDLTLGRISPWARVEIVGPDEVPVARGHEGAIRVRTTGMVDGYLASHSSSPGCAGIRNGWFYPGDIGRMTDDDRLLLIGRADDRLNVGGVKIDAALVDRKLESCSGVEECAAFVWEDKTCGSVRLGLAVVPVPGGPQDSLQETVLHACQVAFGDTVKPDRIVFVPSLPRNAGGKLLRNQLACHAAE